jgi:hypothetical protein
LATSAIAAAAAFCGCGGDAALSISKPAGQCTSGAGPQIEGVVQMPHGSVAQNGSALERVARAIWAQAAALTGTVSRVGAQVEVTLVELRPEDVINGTDPGAIDVARTGDNGEFCIRLPGGTDENVCRYIVQVGDREDGTLTRAFVFSVNPDQSIDIDFRSEATVRLILEQIPPASLCDFSPQEINHIYNAVSNAPGEAVGENADEINAVATSIAASDPVVVAAISSSIPPRTPVAMTPTTTPPIALPSATPTGTGPKGATPTRTAITARTSTPTQRSTRTPLPPTRTPA